MKIAYNASRARTPLREGCEADQRQATKQEAQPPNGEQSVISCIFRVFLNNLRNSLPGCKVAHSIRRSYLYKKVDEDDNVQSEISEKYPLTYYYIRKENTVSFYYYKNNLIAYYTHSAQDKVMYILPLYDYTKMTMKSYYQITNITLSFITRYLCSKHLIARYIYYIRKVFHLKS